MNLNLKDLLVAMSVNDATIVVTALLQTSALPPGVKAAAQNLVAAGAALEAAITAGV